MHRGLHISVHRWGHRLPSCSGAVLSRPGVEKDGVYLLQAGVFVPNFLKHNSASPEIGRLYVRTFFRIARNRRATKGRFSVLFRLPEFFEFRYVDPVQAEQETRLVSRNLHKRYFVTLSLFETRTGFGYRIRQTGIRKGS